MSGDDLKSGYLVSGVKWLGLNGVEKEAVILYEDVFGCNLVVVVGFNMWSFNFPTTDRGYLQVIHEGIEVPLCHQPAGPETMMIIKSFHTSSLTGPSPESPASPHPGLSS